MNKEIVEKGLRPTANTGQRIEAFIEAGISARAITAALGVSPGALYHWKSGRRAPLREAFIKIDDMRFAMESLVIAGLHPTQAAQLMQGRLIEAEHTTFLELLVERPEEAFDRLRTFTNI